MLTKDQFGFNAFWWERLHTEDQIKECVDYIASLGFRYIEFKRLSFKQENLEKELKMAVDIAQEAGLKVSDFAVLRSLTDGNEQNINDIIDTIRAASQAGVNVINTVSGGTSEPIKAAPEDWWMPAQQNHGPAWDNLFKALEKICGELEKCDTYLAMEPLTGALVHDFYSIQEMYSRIDHPRLGITMDPSHLLLYRNDIPYAIKRLGNKIKHVHMKDAVGRAGEFGLDFMFPTLGAGAIDWNAFFRTLDEINYQGAISGEYEQFKYMAQVRNNSPEFAAKTMYEEMVSLYDLWSTDR